MDNNNDQSSQWDFSELQYSLEKTFGSPETLLLEAYKGLFDLINYANSDTEKELISNATFPIDIILSSVYKAVQKRK